MVAENRSKEPVFGPGNQRVQLVETFFFRSVARSQGRVMKFNSFTKLQDGQ